MINWSWWLLVKMTASFWPGARSVVYIWTIYFRIFSLRHHWQTLSGFMVRKLIFGSSFSYCCLDTIFAYRWDIHDCNNINNSTLFRKSPCCFAASVILLLTALMPKRSFDKSWVIEAISRNPGDNLVCRDHVHSKCSGILLHGTVWRVNQYGRAHGKQRCVMKKYKYWKSQRWSGFAILAKRFDFFIVKWESRIGDLLSRYSRLVFISIAVGSGFKYAVPTSRSWPR